MCDRISGLGFRVSGFGFRASGFGSRVSGFGCEHRVRPPQALLGPLIRREVERMSGDRPCRYSSQFENNYFTEMCSGSEAGSYLRLIDFVCHPTRGLRVIKKKIAPVGFGVEGLVGVWGVGYRV